MVQIPKRKPAKRLRFGKEETASGDPIFSALPEKMGEKRDAGYGLVRTAGAIQASPDFQLLRAHELTLRALQYAPPVTGHQIYE